VTITANEIARPASIEDPTNLWFVHPVSDRLLPLAIRLGLHPNTVSIGGLVCGAIAGLCYANWRDPWWVVAGFLWMLGWHVLDGLDGKLARATGKSSPLGRVIDGVCDYFVFFFVLIPIVLSFEDWPPVLALAVASGVCHALQAAWYQGEREAWKRRARGVFQPETRVVSGWWIENNYNKFESRFAAGSPEIDAMLRARPSLLGSYQQATAPIVRSMALLSSNARTIAIALACLAGDPRLYWYWEMVGMSLIALALATWLRRTESGLVSRFAETDNADLPYGQRQNGE
jgi:phosphatidylglycerophosphate synthase